MFEKILEKMFEMGHWEWNFCFFEMISSYSNNQIYDQKLELSDI
jgi:hypothetical protein